MICTGCKTEGLHSASNIVMACRSCNSKKKDLTEKQFRKFHENENITKRV